MDGHAGRGFPTSAHVRPQAAASAKLQNDPEKPYLFRPEILEPVRPQEGQNSSPCQATSAKLQNDPENPSITTLSSGFQFRPEILEPSPAKIPQPA